ALYHRNIYLGSHVSYLASFLPFSIRRTHVYLDGNFQNIILWNNALDFIAPRVSQFYKRKKGENIPDGNS
ncbi:MAG: hypothetical protein V7K64_20915, partial [Nostoc sp.]